MRNLGIVMLVALTAVGCRKDEGLDPSDVNEAYGGLTTADEAPLFGEPGVYALLGAAQADFTMTDAVASEPAFQEAAGAAETLHYLFLAWGNLKRDAEDGAGAALTPRDFSGSLALSEGQVVVLRKIRMEVRQEDGVLPRTDPALLEWQSTIYGGVDGLLVKIVAPDAATVTATLAGQTITKSVADLDLTKGLIDLPDSDDGIVYAAAAVRKTGCPHGFMLGRRHQVRAQGGVFRGKWVSADGELRGHLRGIYGQRRNGEQVFFGKWIAEGGEFQGLLAGRYADGEYQGHYLDRDLALHGRVKGIYFDPPVEVRRVGFLLGTWHEACEAEPLDPSETAVQ
jgi:hypothetical protein